MIADISDWIARIVVAVAIALGVAASAWGYGSIVMADPVPYKPFPEAQRQPLTEADQLAADEASRDSCGQGPRC